MHLLRGVAPPGTGKQRGGKALAGEMILIIDDNADVRTLLAERVLPSYGYRTLVAPDGQEGLWQIRTHRPDLILLDLRLPDMTGIDLLHILSSEGYDTPVILITAYGSELIAAQALRLGVQDYIIKPFTLDEIVESVERALTTLRLRHERNLLTERLRCCSEALRLLAEARSELARQDSPDARLCCLLELFLSATQATFGRVWIRDEAGEMSLRAVQRRGDARAHLRRQPEEMPVHVRETFATGIFQQGQSATEGLQEITVAIPITIFGRPGAVLEAGLAREQISPDDPWLWAARAIAEQIGPALEEAQLKERLNLLEQENQAMQRLSRDALIVLDEKDTIVAITPTIEGLTGQRPEELIGTGFRTWIQQIRPVGAEPLEWYWRPPEEGSGQERYALPFRGSQGEARQAEVQVLARKEGPALRRYLLLHEETALNRLEQEVRSLRHILGEVVRGASQGLLLTDLDGTVLGANAVAMELLGRSVEELLGQPLWEAFSTAEGAHFLPEEMARAYRQGSGFAEVSWPARGSQTWGIAPLLLLGAGGTPHALAVLVGPGPSSLSGHVPAPTAPGQHP